MLDAQLQGLPVPGLSQRFPELTVADACAVRDELVALRLAAGDFLIGAKASRSVGDLELGWLTSSMVRDELSDHVAVADCDRSVALVFRRLPRRSALHAVGLVTAAEQVCLCLEPQQRANSQRLDALAANLDTTSISLRPRHDLAVEPVVEALLWLAGYCLDNNSPLATLARAGRFILVSPPAHRPDRLTFRCGVQVRGTLTAVESEEVPMVTPNVVEISHHRECGRTSPVAGQRDLVIASLLTQRGCRVRPPSGTHTEGRRNPDGKEQRRQR